jgi:hypothetical protein
LVVLIKKNRKEYRNRNNDKGKKERETRRMRDINRREEGVRLEKRMNNKKG